MNFSYLKSDYEERINEKGKKDRIENKQRINISDHAYLTLQNDIAIFLRQSDQPDLGKIPSRLINRVFRNFRKSADSSIACRLGEKKMEYEHLLAKEKFGEKKKIISVFIEDYKAKLLQLHEVSDMAQKNGTLGMILEEINSEIEESRNQRRLEGEEQA